MNKNITITLLLIFNLIPSYSQDLKPYEKFAFEYIEDKLSMAGVETKFIYECIKKLPNLLSQNDKMGMHKYYSEVDSILTISGFYKNHHVDYSSLVDCFEHGYKLQGKGTNTLSSYDQFRTYLKKLNDHQELAQQLSSKLLLSKLPTIILEKDRQKDLYRIPSIFMFLSTWEVLYNDSKNGLSSINRDHQASDLDKTDEINMIDDHNTNSDSEEETSLNEDKAPEFPGGQYAFKNYLKNELIHPDESDKRMSIVYVQFTIDKTGKVKESQIARGLSADYNNEAL